MEVNSMKQEYLENARKNGSQIYENTEKIFTALCETISLITDKECSYDMLYNGNVIIRREGEENQLYNTASEAMRALTNIIDTLYQ